jgi:adenylate cyclase
MAAALLDGLDTAAAAVDPATLRVLYANARFAKLFGASVPTGDEAGAEAAAETGAGLVECIHPPDSQMMQDRLARGRPYRFETEVDTPPRATALLIEVRPPAPGRDGPVIVEATAIGKQKEAEYMLDSYSRMVERQTRALQQEKERVDRLLLNIMPRRVYDELKEFGTTTPQSFTTASVIMLDFVGFTEMAVSRDPGALIAELNDIFTSFDRIVEHFRCERIKTIGDAYMAVAGVPEPDPDHDVNVARAALRMRSFIHKRNAASANRWRCRIGVGRGPVIGSIVGIQKYVYDIFGPGVNLAARLEQLSEPGQILVGAETYERIRDEFVLRPLGPVEVRGFGPQQLYALEDETRKGR